MGKVSGNIPALLCSQHPTFSFCLCGMLGPTAHHYGPKYPNQHISYKPQPLLQHIVSTPNEHCVTGNPKCPIIPV